MDEFQLANRWIPCEEASERGPDSLFDRIRVVDLGRGTGIDY
jgi:hypothetical protein